ncbi:MAG: YggS family pyridoxal phosphate-dependent enzyme [Verrucomicrobiaceae bacterium]|nr:YggS family pyridoxal phosphate-dependent enzyme [Verrucomicrobiaceae bacterium]
MSTIAENLETVRQRVAAAAGRSGRKPGDVELLVVSKTFPAEVVREAADAGQTLFGENKVQELLAKIPLLPSSLRWHLIGHLQSNKVRKVLPFVEAIHSVTSLDLAKDINRIAGELGLFPKVYLEINVGAEASKFGFDAKSVCGQLEELYKLDRLFIQGLMCIPPFAPEVEKSRPYFAGLRELRDKLEKLGGAPLPKLSMGMSHDFEIAVEEGATIVRVGSAIFGSRAVPQPQ